MKEAQSRCDAVEFAEWMAEYRLEPFGDERGDINAAMICTLVANAMKGKGGKTYKLSDFMPEFGKERKQQSVADMAMAMNVFASMHNMSLKGRKNGSSLATR